MSEQITPITCDEQPQIERKPIPGYDGYFAGSDGSIWSTRWKQMVFKKGYGGTPGNGMRGTISRLDGPMRRLRLRIRRGGYWCVSLRKWSERKAGTAFVHRLVALAFFGLPSSDKMEVAHNNGIRTDCRKDNLRWATKSENQKDRNEHGTDNRGEKHVFAKLTDTQVRQIKAEYIRGKFGYTRLANKYGVSDRLIHKIIKGISWSHIK